MNNVGPPMAHAHPLLNGRTRLAKGQVKTTPVNQGKRLKTCLN
jgi:hypothetical protein